VELDCRGEVIYATGDYGVFTDAGELIFLGRRDSQVKVNGQRVDLSEIKRVLAGLAGLATGFYVLPVKDPAGRDRIYSFVSKEKKYSRQPVNLVQDSALIKELYSVCRAALPLYMIPKFVVVSAIPINLSGKIDERSLSRIVKARLHTHSEGAMGTVVDKPLQTTEGLQGTLAAIVGRRFSGNLPSIDDDLISYGLTSLDFMVFIKDVKTTFGVSLTFRQVFSNPDIRTITKILKERMLQTHLVRNIQTDRSSSLHQAADERETKFVKAPETCWVQPSAGQEMMFSAQSVLRNHAYNCNFVLRIESFPLDPEILISALKFVCSRHEILRSTYHDALSNPQAETHITTPICGQKIHEKGKLGPVCRVNLPDPSREGSHEETTLASIEKEAAIVFDLGNDSPVRMTIYQLSMSGDNWMIHFNIHHIAIDEWGFENLCRELEFVYRALQLDDGSLSLVAEPLQYSEFSRCYQTRDACNQQHERLKWWLRNIDTETSENFLSELQVHRPSEFLARIEDDQSLVHTRTLDLKQVRLFEAKVCKGSTPFIAWLTLCQIVLARMTRKAKFALAVPVTNRGMDPRFLDVVGFCLNTLLVPVELTSKDTFQSSIRTTQRTFDACVANSLPLGMVVEALLKERPMTSKFMPEVMFVYHDSDSNPSTGIEGTSPNFLQDAERIQLPSVGSRFDLVIHFSKKHPDTPQLTFEFRRSLFSQDFVEAMARCFETALCDIIAEGNQKPYGQITCLSTIDEALILEWSSPPPPSELMTATWVQGHGCLLHQLVELTALKAPQAMAVVTKSGYTLTYAELIAKARVLCQWLRANGLTHQMTAVLLLNLSVELVIARLAVLMGGGTFLALDPQHKVAINQAKVEVSCPGMVIFNSATAPTLGSLRLEENVRGVNISLSTDSTPTRSDIRITVTEDAYLCFTSGSTGDAKFFPISHAAAAASIMSHIERFQLDIGDRVGMVCSTTFDVSVLEMFAALAAGAVLCIGSQDEILTDLAHTLDSLAITHIFATPTLVSLLEGPAQVPSLRFVALLGEPTTVKLFELWARSVDLQNAYGPAEVALNTHSRSFSSTDDKSRVTQRIGTSMPSVRSYVLDIDGNLTLPGCVGHLNIGDCDPGKLGHLSRGYITPAAANIRYTNHPKFGRLYNTGDLCFYTFDGELNLLGREDDQVKLHGVRMNLGDIERTVRGNANQQVAAAVCEISESSNPEQAIALFVNFPSSEYVPDVARAYSTCPWLLALSPEIRESLRELRLQAAEKLADVMVPKFWLPVNTFARNDNGKMDRKAIKSWAAEFSSFNRKSEYAILSSPVATTQGVKRLRKTWLGKILIDTWKCLFRLSGDEIDVETTFLHVGGDSISAIRYVSSLRSKEVVGCTVSRLYDSPTLSRLHDALQPLQVPRSSPVPSDIKSSVPGGNSTRRFLRNMPDSKTRNALVADALGFSETVIKKVYPTTSMQRAMLLQTESHPELYITQVILSLQGKLDIERMSSAWHAVCSAHPTMHTTFVRILSGNELSFFAVEVKPSALFGSPRISQRPTLSDTLESELKVERERIFKLGGTMFRLLIAEGEEQTHKLILSCHHSSCDGWSLDIILRSLANAYQGHPLLPTPSFSEMVSFDAERDKSEAKLFWKTYLQNYNPTSLTWNLSNPRLVKMKAAERMTTSISASSLSRFAKQRNVTPAVIMQAAWSVLLSNMMGTDDVVFGVVVSGRDVEVNNVVEMAGNFLNTIPLRVYVDRDSDPSQWLQHIHQSSIKSLEHHHLSLEEMMRQSDDGSRIFETVFIFENQAIRLDKSAFGSLRLERIDGREFSEIPLTLVLEFADDGLMVTVKFNNAIFPVLQIETMIDNYLDILSDILAKATMAKLGRSEPYDELLYVKELLGSLSIQARDTNNDTLISYFTQSTQLFLDKIAIEEDACSVTFSELSTRSDTVRDFIAQAGLRNNQVVPIIFSHSIDMVVAMLGIMKAGAAYCPIDVDAPEGKIRYVVEKVAARVIVGDADYRKKVSNIFLAEFDFVSIREIEQMRMKSGTKASAVGISVTPQDPCYVLFTSGSTGLPKGCILTHSAVLNAVLQTSSKTQITEVSRVLLFANYVFDASVIDIFGSLLTGGTLCISSRTRLLSGLQKVILDRQISHIHLTPSVAQVLSAGSCPSLKTLVIGGERMVPTLRDRWADRVKLFDGYGPTECAIQVSTTLVSPLSDVGIISESLPGNMIILLDRRGEIPRVGEVGEICIGGHQVFSGYIGEPKATERALRRSPIFKSRFFGTGDLGRYRRDMTIQLLGRKDTEVKLSGERVEVEEIESIICSFEAVERCAVLAEKNQLYAIVEEREGTSGPTAKEIKEWCFRSLPSRLVPLVLFWPDLPLTPSNKLDRRAITQRFREMKISSAIGTEHMLNSETEHVIAAMVVKINGHELQDATLPLQHSGLNSLDILHLRSALAERYGFSLALTQFWLAASIRSLAKSIEEKLELPVNSKEEASVATGDTLLASDSQVAIWMAQKSYADSTYNVGSVLHIPNIDPHRLCSSIRNVIQSLDIFRIKFEWNYDLETLQQRLNLASDVPVELYDLVNCEEGTAALKRFCSENHKTVFDLECGPLARFWVLLLNSECYLYYNIHHILVDEWTCEKLTDAFLKEYCGLPWHDGMRPSWNSLMHVWRSESCKDTAMENWKQNLNGVTTFDTHSWPRGNVANEVRTAGSTSVFKVPLEVLQQIRNDINGDLSSLFISLLCAFQVLLHQ
jgi:amino acid adenylation domain-containing protein